MRIKSIRIDRLFNEFDYELAFNEGLTFIHSLNGRGKSTIMQMMCCIFNGDFESISEIPFERMDLILTDDTAVIVENDDGKVNVLIQKNKLKSKASENDVDGLGKITYIPPDRITMKKKDGHIINTLEAYAQELAETIRNAKENKVLGDYKGERKAMSDSELEFWCKDLKARLDFIKDAGFEPTFPPGCHFPPSRSDLMSNRAGNEDVAFSVSEYVDRIYPLAESIIVFKDIVNNIFVNKNIEVSDTGKLIVKMNNGTVLPMNKLSSGETHIILLFFAILFHSSNEGIVIIDEPEISLHITWQQALGDYFNDICRVRGTQMIVATHSPQVIHDKWDRAVELRQKNA